jgi:hypothetical protein
VLTVTFWREIRTNAARTTAGITIEPRMRGLT